MEDIENPEPYSEEEKLEFVREWIEDGNDDFAIEDGEIVYTEDREIQINLPGSLIADLEEFHGFTPVEVVEEILSATRKHSEIKEEAKKAGLDLENQSMFDNE